MLVGDKQRTHKSSGSSNISVRSPVLIHSSRRESPLYKSLGAFDVIHRSPAVAARAYQFVTF